MNMKYELAQEMKRLKEWLANKKKGLTLSVGFLMGAMLFFIYKEDFVASRFMKLEEELKLMQQIELDANLFLPYLLKIRTEQLLILYLISRINQKTIAEHFFRFLAGLLFGVFQTIAIYRYGLKGILLTVLLMFPQIFFYYAVFQIFFHNSSKNGTYYSWRGKLAKSFPQLMRYILAVCLFLCGVISECYVNTIILHKVSYLFA